MKILKSCCKTELSVKGSKFISELFPCENQQEAKNIIKSQKSKYQDATHVVHAFILGLSKEILGSSDDGEPSGTAGRPALEVLKGSFSTNMVLTVTRYFGGTLLGTGGLVKAYTDSAKSVLQKAEEESLLEEYIAKTDFSFCTDYSFHKTAKHILESFSVFDIKEEFSTDVKISGKIITTEAEKLKTELKNLSNGKINL